MSLSDPQLVGRRLEEFRRSLLDTSLRNRLIHFRTRTNGGKSLEKIVEVHGEDPVELYRILVTDGKAMSFVGKPDPRPAKAEKAPLLETINDYGDEASLDELREDAEHELDTFIKSGTEVVDQTDLKLNTRDTVSALQRKLTKIHRDAKVALEEQGVNVLFLAMGSLVWYESDTSTEERRAPLLMVPVTLERTNAGAFRLKWDGTDPGGNLSIAAKLRGELGIRLPDLPDELDVTAYFKEIGGAIRSQPRWTIDRSSAALGFLSYAKFLMYRDLDPSGWPDSDKPELHPTLGALLDGGFEEDEPSVGEEQFLDPLRTAYEACDVYDADGSQTLAILEANTGRSMVVEGPPGTGKSQTITNLIAEFVAAGKKVLFIAEKAAALDVVYRRLREAHLEDACLELHSNKANKRSFYTELKRTVSIAAPKTAQADEDLRRLEETKAILNDYVVGVNAPLDGREVSPRFVMGRLIALGKEPSPEGRHDFARMTGWSEADFQRRLDLVRKVQKHVAETGRPMDHPYFGCTLDHLIPADKEDIARLLLVAEEAVETFHLSANALAEALRVELPVHPADVEKLREWARFVAHAPHVQGVEVGRSDWTEIAVPLRALATSGRRLSDLEALLSSSILPTELDRDVSDLRRVLSFGGLTSSATDSITNSAFAPSHRALDAAANAGFEALDAAQLLGRDLGISVPEGFAGMESLAVVAKRVATGPDVSGVPITESRWAQSRSELEEALADVRKYSELRSRYGSSVTETGWNADVAADLDTIEKQGGSFFRIFNGAFRSAMARSATHLASPTNSPHDRIAVLKAIIESRESERRTKAYVGRGTALFGDRWEGVRSDPDVLAEVASWVQELHTSVEAGKLPREVLASLERGIDRKAAGAAGDALRQKAGAAAKAIQLLRGELSKVGIRDIEATGPDASERVLTWLALTLRPALRELKTVVVKAETMGFGPCLENLDLLTERQALKATVNASTETARPMGSYYQGSATDWTKFESVLDWVLNLHSSVRSEALPDGLLTFFAEDRPRAGLDAAVATAQALRQRAQEAVHNALVKARLHDDPNAFTEEAIVAQRTKIAHWKARIDDLPALIKYNSLSSEAERLGLGESVELAETWPNAGARLSEAFERSWYTGLVREAVTTRPILARFDRATHETTLQAFREFDDIVLRYNRAKVALAHWRTVPRTTIGGAMGWLGVQFGLRQNHKAIRTAMEKAGEAVQAIKPVFLMSPLSVAMYLPANGPRFDVVIFDEASQVKPEDAFGGVLRAKQTIVVGDSKQMPPTSFFDKLTSEADGDDEELEEIKAAPIKELESVLALMSARLPAVSPRRRDLRWHYRSHHDGLIATSNRLFYDDRLVVFPSPRRSGSYDGLILRHDPTTVYGRGGSRKNLGEAKAVALAAQRHVREYPKLTLGIAAFSKAQQEAIQDELDLLKTGDSAFAAFDALHPFEQLFVKNLENVQGDERDVILISVGYGRDENGFISASFGPLNRDGGERRLNVLITRARIRCEVFTNLKAVDVRLTENVSRGVLALKTFLAFADTGSLDVPASTGMDPQSPFEEVVLQRLRAAGYDAEPQVGSCGFYIDIAVHHPEQPGRFVLGIECDGAMYHRARSARDRDKLRQSVLERRGWRIHRIWSTDWFQNSDREFDRLIQVLQASIHVADEEREAEVESARPSDFVELERDETVQVDESIPPYQICELQIETWGEPLHERPTSDLASWVAKVVEVESPVHMDEVVRRIREAAGFARAGGRIQAAVERGIELAERQGRTLRSGAFLYLPSTAEVVVRSRAGLPAQAKKLDYVSDDEITAALLQVVERAFGIDRNEVITLTSKRLGFDRTTGQMSERIAGCIEAAIAEGKLRNENDLLKIDKGTG